MEQLLESAGVMHDGVVQQIGLWDCALEQTEAMLEHAKLVKPVCNMVELHPLHSQRRLVGTLRRKVRCTGCYIGIAISVEDSL